MARASHALLFDSPAAELERYAAPTFVPSERMFEGWQRLAHRPDDLGPQPQQGQQILDRAFALGALSPATARTRRDLDVRHDPSWTELLACGYLTEAKPGCYYLTHSDGSADRMLGAWSARGVFMAVAIVSGILLFIFRRLGN